LKIDYLKVNGFGKLSNKELKLNKNINIISGQNETGKSTLLKFINCMFYGASKNKNGKDISDFDKYKPWKVEEFSGKIRYTLDNKESFEIYRDFKKKSPIIYNDKLQDISSNFMIDKNKGIDFIYEQIGIDEETFKNTVITSQGEIKIEKNGQNVLIQKVSNIISSGDENVSFKKTLEKINKLQLEQVGSDRSSQKPINIVNDKIKELQYKKEELEEYKTILNNDSNNYESMLSSIELEEEKLELLKHVKENLEKNKFSDAELDINKRIIEEYNEKIKILKNKVDIGAKQNIRAEKKSFLKYWIMMLIILIISIVTFIIDIPKIIPVLFIMILGIIGIITFLQVNKFKNEKKSKIEEISNLQKQIKEEIKILEKNKLDRENEINTKLENIKNIKNEANSSILNEFEEKLDIEFIKMILEMNLDEILVAISTKEEQLNSLKFEIKTNEINKNQMQEKIDDLFKVEEELESIIQERNELISLNNSYNIAKECMEAAYEEIRNSLNPKFISELSELIKNVSNDKYKNIKFNDEEGLTAEIEDGRYMPVERLSIGTIDQMYLALRLSSINNISNENMPIILDESFVFFDDERLKNIFSFINSNYSDKQVIIFTCSKREEEVLKKLNIDYSIFNL